MFVGDTLNGKRNDGGMYFDMSAFAKKERSISTYVKQLKLSDMWKPKKSSKYNKNAT